MGDMFEMIQTGPHNGETVVLAEEDVTTIDFDLAGTIRLPCTDAEEMVIRHLSMWLMSADEDRFWALELAFLQFDYNRGNEHFTADQIRELRAFLSEQRGTNRWNGTTAGLLTKFETAEAALRA